MKLIELTRPIFISSLKHKEQVRRFDYNNESDLNACPRNLVDYAHMLQTIHACLWICMDSNTSGYSQHGHIIVVSLVSINHEYVFQ